MADNEVEVEIPVEENGDNGDDQTMGEAEAEATAAPEDEPSGLENIEPVVPEHITFLDYLRSPIVELVIGTGADATTLYAHQGLLKPSPFFAEACAQFDENAQPRRIELPDDDLSAASSVIEFLYKGDYFPTITNQAMEYDSTVPHPDNEGVALLRHARVYTLAKRLELPTLATLAHRKIHLTQSTAKGEIEYARFVYKETSAEDSIRRPVAQFWATRSHVLRHEAEQEFKRMCLEYPQFGFDVLSLVLDAQEKRSSRAEVVSSGTSSGRKRQRVSNVRP